VAYRLLNHAYFSAADRCMRDGRHDEAAMLLERGVAFPGHRSEERYHGRLALIAQARGDDRAVEAHRARARALRQRYDEAHTATARNYRAARDLLRRHGVTLVAVQYPLRDVESLRGMFDDDTGIVFVDNETPFREALGGASYTDYFTDAFAGDFGHLTRRGNRLLAETIARAIEGALLARDGPA
jgi:hypothetical protein